jgi:chorismate synthase
MRGNTFGKMYSVTSFGESHGPAIGVVIDGVPAGLEVDLNILKKELFRRAPGQTRGTTSRKEMDEPSVLSGLYEGKTLGTPICVVIENTNQKSKDYDSLKESYRPGHADQTTMLKYGHRDHRGGGRASGRETIARVIGGYFASLIIPEVQVKAFMMKMGPFHSESIPNDLSIDYGPYYYPDCTQEKIKEIESYLVGLKKSGDSRGGRVSIVALKVPTGLGEPAFDKMKADLAKALMSIGAVVSFSYGLGEEMAEMSGQEVSQNKSNFGGIEGGITNGDDLLMNITFKPTSTVGDKAKEGRHDPCIIPRAIPVVEAMVKIVLADHFLRQRAYEL